MKPGEWLCVTGAPPAGRGTSVRRRIRSPAASRTPRCWATALDCPGGWTLDIVGRPAVLGRITAQVDALPAVGEPCVVMGRLLRRSGRKGISATTVYDGDGRVLGRAEAVWIEIDPQKS